MTVSFSSLSTSELLRYNKRLELQVMPGLLIDVNTLYRKKTALVREDFVGLISRATLIVEDMRRAERIERDKGMFSDERYIAYIRHAIRQHHDFTDWCMSRIETIEEVKRLGDSYEKLQLVPHTLIGGTDV